MKIPSTQPARTRKLKAWNQILAVRCCLEINTHDSTSAWMSTQIQDAFVLQQHSWRKRSNFLFVFAHRKRFASLANQTLLLSTNFSCQPTHLRLSVKTSLHQLKHYFSLTATTPPSLGLSTKTLHVSLSTKFSCLSVHQNLPLFVN